MVALCCLASAPLACWALVWPGLSHLYRWGNRSIWEPCFPCLLLSLTLFPCPLWDGLSLLPIWDPSASRACPSQPH